jgi:hypothetical protein
MSSHIHLLLQLGIVRLGEFSKIVNTSWARWLNRATGRIGTTMADRPNSVFCDSATYGLELVRYIHNNPVRAGLVATAEDSTWSSHRAYLGLEPAPTWLTIDPILKRFSEDDRLARQKLGAFVYDGRQEPRRPEFSGSITREMRKKIVDLVGGPVEISYPVLGPDEFILKVFGRQQDENKDDRVFRGIDVGAMDIVRLVCKEQGLDVLDMLGRNRSRRVTFGRKMVAYVWCELLRKPQVTLAELFGMNPSSISKMLRGRKERGIFSAPELEFQVEIEKVKIRLIDKLKAVQKRCSKKKDENSAQVLLLRRQREVGEKLL